MNIGKLYNQNILHEWLGMLSTRHITYLFNLAAREKVAGQSSELMGEAAADCIENTQ